ncbi:MAG TPA: phosphohistidine phosphatase SixA [Acidobacteriota bacterium]|nr:phosphohistidine phosphatase SixA [Acidobacteriota bacterium]
MEIYIVRHGISEDSPSKGGGDAARALTEEGRQKMKEAAAGFARLDYSIDRIFSSPLVRAKQTAEIIAKAIDGKVEEMAELSPGYSPEQVCSKLHALKKLDSVMLVGHEPNCSILASYLLEGSTSLEIQFKKGAICRIDVSSPARKSGILIFHLTPQALRLMK